MRLSMSLAACATLILISTSALAQSDIAPRSAISVVGGAGSTSSKTGLALGGSWLFDLNDRTSLEAQAAFLDRGAGTDAISVSGGLLVNLLPTSKRTVPYAAVGGGIYRTSFDLGNRALLGPVGAQFGPGHQSWAIGA